MNLLESVLHNQNTLFILLALALFLLLLLFKKKSLSYEKCPALFTPAEQHFFRVLQHSLPKGYLLFGKIRVADVLLPKKGIDKKSWIVAFNKVSRKHFDYVIVEASSLQVALTIELDDRSHLLQKRKKRDLFLESACKSANVTLLRFPVQKSYDTKMITKTLQSYL
jgi:hypothetical protein